MFLLPSEVGFLKLLKENRVPLVEVSGSWSEGSDCVNEASADLWR